MESNPVTDSLARHRAAITYFLILLASALIAGLAGLITSLLMYWMTFQKFGVDLSSKHGISDQDSSRLGGLAVAICASVFYLISIYLEMFYVGIATIQTNAWLVVCSLAIGFVGFWGDLLEDLSPKARLFLMAFILATCFVLVPDILPEAVGLPGIDFLLGWRSLSFVLSLMACLALVNAANMADGANGLMPIVFAGIFYTFFLISLDVLYLSIMAAFIVFALFNVASGKLFLGDFGSYCFGAFASLCALHLVGQSEAELWLFLCLAAYPIIDFFVSIVRRILAGRSPLAADCDHMHNRLYRFFRGVNFPPLLANSLSGLTISVSSTGSSIFFLSTWSIDSGMWAVYFFSLVVVFITAYLLLPSSEIQLPD